MKENLSAWYLHFKTQPRPVAKNATLAFWLGIKPMTQQI